MDIKLAKEAALRGIGLVENGTGIHVMSSVLNAFQAINAYLRPAAVQTGEASVPYGLHNWPEAPITETEDMAIRAARLVRTILTWDDADAALVRARVLLKEWRVTQPHPHSGK